MYKNPLVHYAKEHLVRMKDVEQVNKFRGEKTVFFLTHCLASFLHCLERQKSCRKIWLLLILECSRLHTLSANSNATSPSRL